MKSDKYVAQDNFYINRNTVEYKWNMGNFHHHDSYEIYFLESGSRKMLVQDRVYELSRGDILLIKPNILHRSMHSGPHTRINIVFNDYFLSEYFSQKAIDYMTSCFNTEFIHLNPDENDKFYKLYLNLSSRLQKRQQHFIILADILDMLISLRNLDNKSYKQEWSHKTKSAAEYIRNNFAVISSIDEIADACFINKSYMCRLFKKEVGMTVFEYLNTIKIQHACKLLENPHLSMTEIAMQCGFSGASYFSFAFKELMNCTPSQFRQKTRSKI